MAVRRWMCRSCRSMNEPRKRKCQACGRKRPVKRQPKHMAAKLSYEEHERRNGGPNCGICGKEPKPGKKHARDHDHRRIRPRGLLCFRCNAAVRAYMTLEWAIKLVLYLAKHAVAEEISPSAVCPYCKKSWGSEHHDLVPGIGYEGCRK